MPPTAVPPTAAAPTSNLELDNTPYEHPDGLFSINLPVGWGVLDEDIRSDGMYVQSPDGVLAVDVSMVNVGRELTDDEFVAFINAVEQNFFATFDNYQAAELQSAGDNVYVQEKTLDIEAGPQTLRSYFWLNGTMVVEVDLWSDTADFDTYIAALDEVAGSLVPNADAVAELPVYAATYTFYGPDDLFTFRVPYSWASARDASDKLILNTFTSPDGQSIFESLYFQNDAPISRSTAGRVTLELLRESFGLDDIRVIDDVVQPDGSERLRWESPGSGRRGTTFFEVRNETVLLLLSWTVNDADYDFYLPVWNTLLESYEVP